MLVPQFIFHVLLNTNITVKDVILKVYTHTHMHNIHAQHVHHTHEYICTPNQAQIDTHT